MSGGKKAHFRLTAAAVGLLVTLSAMTQAVAQTSYQRTNLVSDIPGVANFADSNLVNPWGIVNAGSTGPIWIADNGTGLSTVYTGEGVAFPTASPLVVIIPTPRHSPAGAVAAPTGIVFNSTSGFVVSAGGNSGASRFIFATEEGTISGWNPTVDPTHAILAVNHSGPGASAGRTRLGAVYKGLAIGNNGSGDFIYATNFRDGMVEMYDTHFQLVKSFTDSEIPSGFAPFGIRNIDGKLFVTYAKQDAKRHDDVKGPGNGYIDIFDLNGILQSRFAADGALNSPWGLAVAPINFGAFSGSLLVGNFGDGRINAFSQSTGNFLGQLQDTFGNPMTINGLWGLEFGNGAHQAPTTTLFFTAGIGDESHGLFGAITSQ
ncbi:TIGR03118 family protein [Terriglobus albidus]|uniref:TIGR03118 family protein n=1 Tax=Terriglobus albidus TaxID=1592106 RepID=UPI0021DFCD4A|nr:TIGR03118 family protein [Terriglobus albidus]